jgi:hypothetical protein
MDNLKMGMALANDARDIMAGGFSVSKMGEAKELMAGASTFFKGLKHFGQEEEEGLEHGEFAGQYGSELKMVTMFSGCRDDQTSADAHIEGEHTGAMTWAFLEMMKADSSPTYADVSTLVTSSPPFLVFSRANSIRTDTQDLQTHVGREQLRPNPTVELWSGH